MQKLKVFLFASVILFCSLLQSQVLTQANLPQALPVTGIYDPALNAKVESLLRRMTLEEKVGQLVQYSAGQPTGPGTGLTNFEEMLAKGQIGGLFNVTTAKETNAFQRIAIEKSRLGIPVLFGLDVIHGLRTEFPIPLALASTWDPALMEKTSRVAAVESAAAGIRWTFSPMVDIARDARWGRIMEGAGEDPFLGSVMAAAYVRGYQGSRLDAANSIAACAKHYVGYGAAEGGRDYNTTEIYEHTLRQYYLPPFHSAVNAGTVTIMSAFNSLNGVPASANPFTLKQILRKEWGFRGIVDSDWNSVGELIPHGVANDPATAARKAFNSGVDMDMVSSYYHDHLAELVRAGSVSKTDLDEAVRRVLRVKFALGLFDRPYVDEAKEATAMLRPASVELARTAAERSLVLLKNDAGANGSALLPLAKSTGKTALIGPLADDSTSMLGAWSALGNKEDVVTLYQALRQSLGDEHLLYEKGGEITRASDQELQVAVEAAQKADVVLLALGEDAAKMTGEAASRVHLGLPGRQEELLEKVVATGKPVVLIVFSGRPLTLPWAFEHVPAVLAAWFPGIQAGPALVRVLYGDAEPSGRLVVSWPRTVGQEPLYYNALSTGRPMNPEDADSSADSNKYVSRYVDGEDSPQFPFGFGLSYSRVRYSPVLITEKQLRAPVLVGQLGKAKTVLTASAEVTNMGARPAEEVVQLYVRLQGASVTQPIRALKAFARISLQPNETRKVEFPLPADAFALWDIQQKYTVEPAKATIWISPDARSGRGSALEITP
jgi:beta-glucosidase